MTFEQIYEHTKAFEGGYVNNPNDKGGETFRGISRKNWPKWVGWPLIDRAKQKVGKAAKAIDKVFAGDAAMEKTVSAFYRENFWQPFDQLEVSGRVQGKLFDMAVNTGRKQAIKFLQRAVNRLGAGIVVDGVVGSNTITAAQSADADRLLPFMASEQKAFYANWAERNPYWKKYLPGFYRRAEWIPSL